MTRRASTRFRTVWALVLALTGGLAVLAAPALGAEAQVDPLSESLDQERDGALDRAESMGPVKALAAECDSDRTCWGAVDALFARILIHQDYARFTTKGVLKQRLAAFGCGETWSIWLHDLQSKEHYLNQITVAQALGDTVWIVFSQNAAEGHCDMAYIYRGVGQ